MLINKVILENYGLYHQAVEFDLTPRVKYNKRRPIILFGGNNGAGKTTLLDAIRLALYGKAVLGNRVSQAEYDNFLRQKIHRAKNSLFSPNHAKVAIQFQHVDMGITHDYEIERSWMVNDSQKIKEYLKIFIDGSLVSDVTEDYWKGFMEEVIPERLSQLFFFDGEKIKAIADDSTSNYALAESIKVLLGIDLVERLKADLVIYNSREVKNISNLEDSAKLTELTVKNSDIQTEIEKINNKIIKVDTEISGIENEITKAENRLVQEGGYYADKRLSLKDRKEQLSKQISELEEVISKECESTFPFALCPSITDSLKEQLIVEQNLRRSQLTIKELEIVKKNLLKSFSKQDHAKVTNQTHHTEIIEEVFKKHIDESRINVENQKEIYGLSAAEEKQIHDWINDAEKRSINVVKEGGNDLHKSNSELHSITRLINKSPDEDLLKPLVDTISAYNHNLGVCNQKKVQLQKELSKLEHQKALAKAEEERITSKYKSEGQAQERLKMVSKIDAALEDYLSEITINKIDQLRKMVAECFNNLSRKGNLIKYIEIDPKTFQVTLVDHTGKSIPKNQLSAGEKQIFAIAMLWGLAKTAQRPLPVIIDTPLGRLDSEHRSKLINNYFPEAAHQVILFSTDTEVDNQLYRELSPNISHCYHLIYDKEKRITEPKEGYFWREPANA